MRKEYLAEVVISLVTSHERAVSIVGDILEDNETRGACRFWLCVVQTGLSQLWQQISAAPFALAGAAIGSMFVTFGFTLLFVVSFVVIELIVVLFFLMAFNLGPPSWMWRWPEALAFHLLVPFLVGRWISQRYPGREAAVSLSWGTLYVVMDIGLQLILLEIGKPHVDIETLSPHLFRLLSYPIAVLAAAAFSRAKSLKSAVL
jgi:hypothetical protein